MTNLKNPLKKSTLTIKFRMIILSSVFILTSVSICTVQFYSLNKIKDHWEHYKYSIEQTEQYLSDMKSSLGYGGMIHHFKNYILRKDLKYVDRGNNSFNSFMSSYNKLINMEGVNEVEKAYLSILMDTIVKYRDALKTARNLYSEGKSIQEVDKVIKIDDSSALNAFSSYEKQLTEEKELVNIELSETISKALYTLLSIFAASIILLILITLRIVSSILKPLAHIVDATKAIAEGDLSRNLIITRDDEIGHLSHNFNAAITSLKELIGSVKSNSDDSQNISSNLNVQATQTSAAVNQITGNIESIKQQFTDLTGSIGSSSTALEEIVANIDSLVNEISNQSSAVTQSSASIEEMSASIDNVATIAKSKKESARSLVTLASDGEKEVDSTRAMIETTAQSVDAILDMISIINGIASQTNLLSMNAAIEAAHAGEAGKGFAVVADEIRKLAETTGNNAKTISVTLKQMVDNIQNALVASKNSGESLQKINKEVNQVVSAFEEIVGSTIELSHGSGEILQTSGQLLNITESIRQGSREMQTGAQEINSELLKVKEISGQSLDDIKEISNGSADISNSVNYIQEISSANRESVSTLVRQISQFKI